MGTVSHPHQGAPALVRQLVMLDSLHNPVHHPQGTQVPKGYIVRPLETIEPYLNVTSPPLKENAIVALTKFFRNLDVGGFGVGKED